ncbi:MAG: 2Fe-2S iron-sulfur cluster-binding protein [Thermomicrobiales bacterium]
MGRTDVALEDAGIDILHRCGGNARCTTCRVDILDGDVGSMTDRERDRLLREIDVSLQRASPARFWWTPISRFG